MRHKLCRCGAVREDRQGSVCPQCKAGAKHKSRNTAQHGYDHAWRLLSERFRKENPLCQMCWKRGIATPADDVHHIVPIDDAPWLRLVMSNLMSVCNECHKGIHAGEVGGRVAGHI
jgi:5-methylcytosine-specific restriction protein A